MRQKYKSEALSVSGLVLAALVGLLVAMLLPDVKRYIRMHRM